MLALTRIMARTAARNLLPPASSGIVIRNLSISHSSMTPPHLHTYDTLNQRLSNPQELLSHYFHKVAAQHTKNGDFFDIHDGIPADKKEYDVLITDMGHKELTHDISSFFGVPYLSVAGGPDLACSVQHAKGMIWGRNRRCLITLATRLEGKTCQRWVHYLFDIGSPKTYISMQAADALEINKRETEILVYIGGHPVPVMVSPEHSHFPEINIIGMDYIGLNKVAVFLDPEERTFKFYFGLAGKMKV